MDGWRWSAGISRWLEVLVMLEEGADPMSPAMPFGRHRGAPLNELPEHYLQWLGGKLDEWREYVIRGGAHLLHAPMRRWEPSPGQ